MTNPVPLPVEGGGEACDRCGGSGKTTLGAAVGVCGGCAGRGTKRLPVPVRVEQGVVGEEFHRATLRMANRAIREGADRLRAVEAERDEAKADAAKVRAREQATASHRDQMAKLSTMWQAKFVEEQVRNRTLTEALEGARALAEKDRHPDDWANYGPAGLAGYEHAMADVLALLPARSAPPEGPDA